MNIFSRWFKKDKTKQSVLFRKFTPFSPKTNKLAFYTDLCVPLGFSPRFINFIRRHQFNNYLLKLKFEMTPSGVVRKLDNKEVSQYRFKQFVEDKEQN